MWNEWQYSLEMTQLFWDPVFYGWDVPPAPRSAPPILLIPGFLAGDLSMMVLGEWLRRQGYDVHYPGIVVNTDCPDRMLTDLVRQIRHLRQSSGRRITLIGHSKGGYLGRALAHRYPKLIGHVVALGSPFNDPLDIHPFTLLLVDLVKSFYRHQHYSGRQQPHYGPLCYSTACTCPFARGLSETLPDDVRYTAVYSRKDGVVRWRHCLTDDADANFEVTGTHLGLIVNSQVYRHLGRILALAPEHYEELQQAAQAS